MAMVSKIKEMIIGSQVWQSMFPGWPWRGTSRDRALHIAGNIWLHLHPTKIRLRALRLTYTWGLGGLSFLLFLVLTLTGVLLMFYYRPTIGFAYQDMKDLEFVVTLGKFLRNAHRWSAHAMVVIVILHMVRVFLTGAYKKPREFNWVIGVALLVLTLFLSFTGYLLPWDQLALWAVTVGTNMAGAIPFLGSEGPFSSLLGINVNSDIRFVLLGGTAVGENALIRFYVLHCVLVPLIAGALMIVHFWRIRKNTFSAAPLKTGVPEERADIWPNLVVREYLVGMLCIAVLILWSTLQNAPLEGIANPTVTPNPSKAPWYFVGLQELLVYFDPWIAGVAIPGLIIFGLGAIPYIDANIKGIGYYSLRERPLANSMFLLGIAMWFILIFTGQYCRGPNWDWYWPWESWLIHKPPPPATWNMPLTFGGLLLMFYFGFGLFAPKLIHRHIPWNKAILSYFVGFILIGTVLKLAVGLSFAKLAIVAFCFFTYFLFGFLFPQRYLRELNWPRYVVTMFLVLLTVGVILKIGLRLGFNVKYIFAIPQYNFNI